MGTENINFNEMDDSTKVMIYAALLGALKEGNFATNGEDEELTIEAIKDALQIAIKYRKNGTLEIDDTRWQACPWCKEKPVLHQEITSALKGGDPVYYMSCDRYACGRPLIYYGASIKETIEEWNSIKLDEEGAEE